MKRARPSTPLFTRAVALAAALSILSQAALADVAERSFWAQRGQAARRIRELPEAGARALAGIEEALSGRRAADVRPAWLSRAGAFPPAEEAFRSDPDAGWVLPLLSADGVFRGFHRPAAPRPGAPLVVQLQDVHGVLEAQRRIRDMVLSLAGSRPGLVLALEGGAGALSAADFRGPSVRVNRRIASFLLNAGLVSGAEAAAVASPAPLRMTGLEEPGLYRRNVAAVQEAAPRRESLRALLASLRGRAEALKSSVYSPALLEWDRKNAARLGEKISLSDHVAFLAGHPRAGPPSAWPQIALFLKARALEEALDFKAVEAERSAFLAALTGRLAEARLEELLQASLAFRTGAITPGAYYGFLKGAAAGAGAPLSGYPRFDQYVRYVLLADGLRPEAFGREVEALSARLGDALCDTPAQRELLRLSRGLTLAGKIADLSLTPSEWDEYVRMKDAVRKLPAGLASLGAPPFSPRESGGWSAALPAVEAFYAAAQSRNAVLAENVLAAAPAGGVVVLVAGGFHTDELVRLLTERGAAVAVAAPKLDASKPLDVRDPFSIFVRGRTPLEKLFEAPRLTTAPGSVMGAFLLTAESSARRDASVPMARALAEAMPRLAGFAGEPAVGPADPRREDVTSAEDGSWAAVAARPADVTRAPFGVAVAEGGADPAQVRPFRGRKALVVDDEESPEVAVFETPPDAGRRFAAAAKGTWLKVSAFSRRVAAGLGERVRWTLKHRGPLVAGAACLVLALCLPDLLGGVHQARAATLAFHVLRHGQALERVARLLLGGGSGRALEAAVSAIQKENRIPDRDVVREGQRIVIPEKYATADAMARLRGETSSLPSVESAAVGVPFGPPAPLAETAAPSPASVPGVGVAESASGLVQAHSDVVIAAALIGLFLAGFLVGRWLAVRRAGGPSLSRGKFRPFRRGALATAGLAVIFLGLMFPRTVLAARAVLVVGRHLYLVPGGAESLQGVAARLLGLKGVRSPSPDEVERVTGALQRINPVADPEAPLPAGIRVRAPAEFETPGILDRFESPAPPAAAAPAAAPDGGAAPDAGAGGAASSPDGGTDGGAPDASLPEARGSAPAHGGLASLFESFPHVDPATGTVLIAVLAVATGLLAGYWSGRRRAARSLSVDTTAAAPRRPGWWKFPLAALGAALAAAGAARLGQPAFASAFRAVADVRGTSVSWAFLLERFTPQLRVQLSLILTLLVTAYMLMWLYTRWESRAKKELRTNGKAGGALDPEAAWREALGADSLTEEDVAAMMQNSWVLRARHRLSPETILKGDPKSSRGPARVLAELARDSAAACAAAPAGRREGAFARRKREAAFLYFESMARYFEELHWSYNMAAAVKMYRAYGGPDGTPREALWRIHRGLQGMQAELKFIKPELVKSIKRAMVLGNRLDNLYDPAVVRWSPEGLVDDLFLAAAGGLEEEGWIASNNERKLISRTGGLLVSIFAPPLVLSLFGAGHWVSVLLSSLAGLFSFVVYQQVANWRGRLKALRYHRAVLRGLERLRKKAEESGPLPAFRNFAELHRRTLGIEWRRSSSALQKERRELSADLVILVPRTAEQKEFFELKKREGSCFHKDAAVVILDPQPQTGRAYLAGDLVLSPESLERLAEEHPRLKGRPLADLNVVTMIACSKDLHALVGDPQERHRMLGGFSDAFRHTFELQLANAYKAVRAWRAGRGTGVRVAAYADRPYVGPTRPGEGDVSLMTAWADWNYVKDRELRVLAVDGRARVRRIYVETDKEKIDEQLLRHGDPARTYDMAGPRQRQFQVFGGVLMEGWGTGEETAARRALLEDLRAQANGRDMQLIADILVPRAILSQLGPDASKEDEEKVKRALEEYLNKPGGHPELAEVFWRHRGSMTGGRLEAPPLSPMESLFVKGDRSSDEAPAEQERGEGGGGESSVTPIRGRGHKDPARRRTVVGTAVVLGLFAGGITAARETPAAAADKPAHASSAAPAEPGPVPAAVPDAGSSSDPVRASLNYFNGRLNPALKAVLAELIRAHARDGGPGTGTGDLSFNEMGAFLAAPMDEERMARAVSALARRDAEAAADRKGRRGDQAWIGRLEKENGARYSRWMSDLNGYFDRHVPSRGKGPAAAPSAVAAAAPEAAGASETDGSPAPSEAEALSPAEQQPAPAAAAPEAEPAPLEVSPREAAPAAAPVRDAVRLVVPAPAFTLTLVRVDVKSPAKEGDAVVRPLSPTTGAKMALTWDWSLGWIGRQALGARAGTIPGRAAESVLAVAGASFVRAGFAETMKRASLASGGTLERTLDGPFPWMFSAGGLSFAEERARSGGKADAAFYAVGAGYDNAVHLELLKTLAANGLDHRLALSLLPHVLWPALQVLTAREPSEGDYAAKTYRPGDDIWNWRIARAKSGANPATWTQLGLLPLADPAFWVPAGLSLLSLADGKVRDMPWALPLITTLRTADGLGLQYGLAGRWDRGGGKKGSWRLYDTRVGADKGGKHSASGQLDGVDVGPLSLTVNGGWSRAPKADGKGFEQSVTVGTEWGGPFFLDGVFPGAKGFRWKAGLNVTQGLGPDGKGSVAGFGALEFKAPAVSAQAPAPEPSPASVTADPAGTEAPAAVTPKGVLGGMAGSLPGFLLVFGAGLALVALGAGSAFALGLPGVFPPAAAGWARAAGQAAALAGYAAPIAWAVRRLRRSVRLSRNPFFRRRQTVPLAAVPRGPAALSRAGYLAALRLMAGPARGGLAEAMADPASRRGLAEVRADRRRAAAAPDGAFRRLWQEASLREAADRLKRNEVRGAAFYFGAAGWDADWTFEGMGASARGREAEVKRAFAAGARFWRSLKREPARAALAAGAPAASQGPGVVEVFAVGALLSPPGPEGSSSQDRDVAWGYIADRAALRRTHRALKDVLVVDGADLTPEAARTRLIGAARRRKLKGARTYLESVRVLVAPRPAFSFEWLRAGVHASEPGWRGLGFEVFAPEAGLFLVDVRRRPKELVEIFIGPRELPALGRLLESMKAAAAALKAA